jgi:hypothetical protein
VTANQILADDPPETWQTVQRLAGLGYDWHNVMHLIMGPVTEAFWTTLASGRGGCTGMPIRPFRFGVRQKRTARPRGAPRPGRLAVG